MKKKSNTYTDPNGYLRYSDSDRPVSRVMAAIKLGRPLKPKEVVHHKNRIKKDNSFSNLYVFKSQAEHDKAHKIDALRFGPQVSFKGFKKKKAKKSFWGF